MKNIFTCCLGLAFFTLSVAMPVYATEIIAAENQSITEQLKNELAQVTTIHWHGVRVPNPMDGVPSMARTPIQPGR